MTWIYVLVCCQQNMPVDYASRYHTTAVHPLPHRHARYALNPTTFAFNLLCGCFCGHSAGGVTVTSADGRIECANTLDARVHIAYQANLPDIRAELFGATAHGLH